MNINSTCYIFPNELRMRKWFVYESIPVQKVYPVAWSFPRTLDQPEICVLFSDHSVEYASKEDVDDLAKTFKFISSIRLCDQDVRNTTQALLKTCSFNQSPKRE